MLKFWEYITSLNLEKCILKVYSRITLGYIVSKGNKLLDPKKFFTIVNMLSLKNMQKFRFSMAWSICTNVLLEILPSSWPQSPSCYER
jgi:hypothetical protein